MVSWNTCTRYRTRSSGITVNGRPICLYTSYRFVYHDSMERTDIFKTVWFKKTVERTTFCDHSVIDRMGNIATSQLLAK